MKRNVIAAAFGLVLLCYVQPALAEPSTQCFVGGCAGQLCSDMPGEVSTCEWLPYYACYRLPSAVCDVTVNGTCGWTGGDEFVDCLFRNDACPYYAPLPLWWCDGGSLADQGPDRLGCPRPPRCERKEGATCGGEHNFVCDDGFVCEHGVCQDENTLTIGALFTTLEKVELNFNISDGFIEFANELYTVDVTSGHVDYVHSNGTLTSGEATAVQLADLIAAVRGAVWRKQPDCTVLAIDGGSFSPQLVVSGDDRAERYGVSDNACAESDHSWVGRVVSCDTYTQIHALLLEILPGGHPPSCAGYW